MMRLCLITAVLLLSVSACTSTGEQKTEKTERVERLETKPSTANLKEASDINVELGVGYIKRKQYKAARDKLEKAIKQNPENMVAYKSLAFLYSTLGLKDEADEKYNEALELKPDDPDVLNSYGAFLCSVDRLEEAQEQFNKAYTNPFYELAYLAESNAGSCYIKQGQYEKAEALLRKSLRKQPKLPGSLLSMADVGVKTGKYLMARAYIERYHAVKKPSPESLWIQIQAEKALGSKDYYMKYARQLIRDFPDSDEAGWVEAQARHEQLR